MLPPVGHGRPLLPMESDPPEHPAYRELLLPRFAPAAVAALEDDIRALARELVDEIADRGRADVYEQLCKPLPLLMITQLLGVERDDEFWEWTDTLMYGRVQGISQERILEVAGELYAYLGREVEKRRARPGDDLISLLLQGTVDGRPYREAEMLDLCFFLLIAGLENTGFGIRATLRHLAVRPDHRAAVLADPSLVHNAVEQSLRLYSPVTALCRTAAEDTDVNGQHIRAGERMLLLFGSANRDETVFEDADEFHLERRDGRHVAFGIGPHRCVGSHLARLEMRIAIEEFLRRVPDFRLAPGPDPGLVRGERAGARVGRGRTQRRRRVKVEVDRSMCVGHAQCSAICPTVFSNDELGYAVVAGDGTVAAADEEDAQLAVDSCPEQAIAVVDD